MMKTYRIATFESDESIPERWNAFLVPEGKDPADYFAENCGLLEDNGQYQTGDTEIEAVVRIFKKCGKRFKQLRLDIK